MRRKRGLMLLMASCLTLLFGCGKSDKETVTNRDIPVDDITAFYYTVENINFNASYQRYRFSVEDGAYLFDHETRERPGDYGPTTEADITASGTVALTDREWADFLAYLKDGTVSAREKSADAGSAGPWTFLYWKNDRGNTRCLTLRIMRRGFGLRHFAPRLPRRSAERRDTAQGRTL